MAESTIFCSQCGTPNQSSVRFCMKCGATVSLLGSGAAITHAPPGPPLPPAPVPYGQPAPSARPGYAQPYGGFWIRFLAVVLDSMILGVILVPIYLILGMLGALGASRLGDNPDEAAIAAFVFSIIGIAIPLIICLSWLYEALSTASSWQGTLGHKICGLKITDMAGNRIGFGRATGRHFAKILSGMIMYIGFIMAGFTEKKQGLHDMICGTLVMKV